MPALGRHVHVWEMSFVFGTSLWPCLPGLEKRQKAGGGGEKKKDGAEDSVSFPVEQPFLLLAVENDSVVLCLIYFHLMVKFIICVSKKHEISSYSNRPLWNKEQTQHCYEGQTL